MRIVHAYAAREKGGKLEPFEYTLGDIGRDQGDIRVESCGLCHSDISLLDNEWGMSAYPLVPGHEVIGVVAALGEDVKDLRVGQRVGQGWFSGSCLHCRSCLRGDQNLRATTEQTIVGRHGGFADTVRCNEPWAIPLPEGLEARDAGPLCCGGITVFNPLVQFGVLPTHKVGVVGIGGLGHMALQFLNKWGCDVTAFTSSPGKEAEAKQMGGHHVVSTGDRSAMEALAGRFDFILNTTNANLPWDLFLNAPAPRGRLHTVGVVPDPIPAPAFTLLAAQRSISGSPLGSPATILDMLDFCTRHGIRPVTEHFAMDDVNAAVECLRSGKARYRIILDNEQAA